MLRFLLGTAFGAALLILNHKCVKQAEERERRRQEATVQRQRYEIDALRGHNKYLREQAEFRTHYEMGAADARRERRKANQDAAMFYEDERVRFGTKKEG